MSNLSNEVPFPKEPINDENPTSSRVMLFTILLLIGGLLLTGTMMLFYANAHRGDVAQTAPDSGESTRSDSPLSAFFEKMSSESSVADSGTTNDANGVMNTFFGGRSDAAVNWPKLKLTGFGSGSEGNAGFAIINKHQYRQGDLIDGKVKLLEIRPHDVLMEYRGETNTLSMRIAD